MKLDAVLVKPSRYLVTLGDASHDLAAIVEQEVARQKEHCSLIYAPPISSAVAKQVANLRATKSERLSIEQYVTDTARKNVFCDAWNASPYLEQFVSSPEEPATLFKQLYSSYNTSDEFYQFLHLVELDRDVTIRAGLRFLAAGLFAGAAAAFPIAAAVSSAASSKQDWFWPGMIATTLFSSGSMVLFDASFLSYGPLNCTRARNALRRLYTDVENDPAYVIRHYT